MKIRILSLIGALALCFVALTGVGTAEASTCPINCAKAQQQCLSGCPCAEFICDLANCWSECVCPIFCPQTS
ncbi:MAG TPA: hypothetical protein VF173_12680 [Thermoanaerobaculia bacterium]|nr:hypothetical protein [Thermoanaerobaculia bacterium]